MKATFEVTCAIPRSGRTLINFLNKIRGLGADSSEIDQILRILSVSKKNSTIDLLTAMQFLEESHKEAPHCFSIFVDRKRSHRPYRLGFLSYEWDINGIRVRVEGEEPHNGSSLIKLDEVDFYHCWLG